MLAKTPSDLLALAQGHSRTIAVAAAEDEDVLRAVLTARGRGIAVPLLSGDAEKIRAIAKNSGLDINGVEIMQAGSPEESVAKSLEAVLQGRAQTLMKGFVNTAVFLKALLDKKYGLRGNGLLSHVALFYPQIYHKPVAVTDAALNTAPSADDKAVILRNAVAVMHKLGVVRPKVALLAHNEVPTDRVPWSKEALLLKARAVRGEFGDVEADGPMALDVAVSKEAAEHKGIKSTVAGDADILLCPEIVSANILYKSMVNLAGARGAAVIMGAAVPVVTSSRSEHSDSKLLSIALAGFLGG